MNPWRFFAGVWMGCCLLHGMGPLHGQGLERGGWTGMALEQQWSDRWSGSLGVETRWGNDLRAHRSSFVDAALEYALNKRYALNFQFRSSLAGPISGALEPVNRAALRLSGNWKWGPGRVEARAMWQYAQRGPWHPEWGWPAEARATQRLRLGYELSRRGPVKLGANVEYMARSAVWNPSALRIRMDSDWKISERWRWGLGYQWEQDLGRTFPERSHTLRMSWTYSLPDRMEHVKTPPIPSPTIAPQPEAALRDSSAFAAAVFLAGGVLGGVEVPGDLPVCLARQVFISEVQTDSPDYVEWHNPSPQPCSLSGWRFDDDLALQDWLGNARAWIPAGGCLLLYAGGLGGFQSGLSAKGDVLFWASPDGGSGQLNLDPVLPGESWHFDVTGAGTRAAPTPGVR